MARWRGILEDHGEGAHPAARAGGGELSSWWAGLPGLDVRVPVVNQRLTNRIVAAACAAHVMPLDPHNRGWTGQLATTAERFLRWLDDAKDGEDGYARRIALCIACTNAGPDARQQTLDTARALYQWLNGGRERGDSELRDLWATGRSA